MDDFNVELHEFSQETADEADKSFASTMQDVEQQTTQAEREAAAIQEEEANKKTGFLGGLREGAKQGIDDIVTAPERAADMVSGTMQKEKEEDAKKRGVPLSEGRYKADNEIFKDEDPLKYTIWGSLGYGVGHLGTIVGGIALSIFGAQAAIGAGGGGALLAGAKGVKMAALSKLPGFLTTGAGKSLALKQGVGAGLNLGKAGIGYDLVSSTSQEANMSAYIRDKVFPQFDNPLATGDMDSPQMFLFKNVAESILLSPLALGAGMLVGKGFDVAKTAAGKAAKGSKPATTAAGEFVQKKARQIDEAANQQAKAELDANLTNDTAEKYFKESDGGLWDELDDEVKEALKLEQYYLSPKKYKGWSPNNETSLERAARIGANDAQDISDQIDEMGVQQLELPGFGGYKNKPLADTHQGAPIATNAPSQVMKQVKRMRTEWGGEMGSVRSVTTPAQIARSVDFADVDGKDLVTVAETYLGEARVARMLDDLSKNYQNPRQVFAEAFSEYKSMYEGRNVSELTVDEFWDPIEQQLKFSTGDVGDNVAFTAWSMKNVVAADLLNASLFRELTDRAIGARTIKDTLDLAAQDGPLKTISDRLIVGLTNVKRSRYLISTEFSKLRTTLGAEKATAAFRKKVAQFHQEAKDAVTLMKEMAEMAETTELQEALMEAFSMANSPRNWDDIDAFMRRQLKGGADADGVVKTGMVVKEVQGTMVHSILSGPKTPMRAIMGTSTATFMRPMATILGSAMSLDGAGIRKGLASMNAMMQTHQKHSLCLRVS